MILTRRNFLRGSAATLIAAPAIVRVASLMKVPSAPSFVFNTTILTLEEFSERYLVPMANEIADGWLYGNLAAKPLPFDTRMVDAA